MPDIDRRAFTLAAAAAGLAAALPARAAATHAVSIANFKFDPAEISIAAGDTVTFTNADGAPHTATADDKSFDTGRLNKGASASLTFGTAGDYAYHCMFHPNMKAVVHVA
jgi:plastocyanin